MKKLFFTVLFSTLLLSCGNEGINQPPDVEFSSSNVSSISGANVLKFDSESALTDAVNELSKLASSKEKLDWVHSHYPGFTSIQDIYTEALVEADEIGDSESDFNNFMKKYDSLYFPLYKEDAGFYVAMRDLNIAFFVNSSYDVIIGNEIKNLKDIDDYSTLMSLGRAYYTIKPNRVASTSDFDDFILPSSGDLNTVGTEYDSGWTQYDKRKVKLKARRRLVDYESKFHTEFCFRKKKPRGWVNYSSKSTINGIIRFSDVYSPISLNKSHDQRSSHDDEVAVPVAINAKYFIFPGLKCQFTISYQGVPNQLSYSWEMKPARADYYPTPKPIHPVIQ